ncbi:MAG: hypothetical protein ABI840_04145 [bacterium]
MKYKIIEILKTFTPKDVKSFNQFLHSPFFNESQKIKNLYKILLRFYPEFNSKFLTEENLSKGLNPNLAFNKSTFKSLLFEMAILAEDYFKILNFKGREIETEDFLRDEFFRRRLYKYFLHNIEKSEKLLNAEKNFNSNYFLNMFQLCTDKHNYLIANTPKASKNFFSQNVSLLNDRSHYLSVMFAKESWVNYDSLMTLKTNFNVDEEKNFVIKLFKIINFEELMLLLISNSTNKNFSITFELNLSLYRLFAGYKNEENYFNYKKLILKNTHALGTDDINFHFGRLITYCMMKKSEKNTSIDFNNELFSVYKYLLLKEYYKMSLNTFLPVELFRIILKHGLEMKKYKWTLEFIKKYYGKLHPDRKMNMYYYSLAEYYFHTKRFELSMKNFQKVQLNHFMLKVDIKNLMLMTYYELGLYENALPLIDTYKHFLSNNETLTDIFKKKMKNFILVVHKMILYKTSSNPMTKYLIKKNLVHDIPYKAWLDEKFLELDDGYMKSA